MQVSDWIDVRPAGSSYMVACYQRSLAQCSERLVLRGTRYKGILRVDSLEQEPLQWTIPSNRDGLFGVGSVIEF